MWSTTITTTATTTTTTTTTTSSSWYLSLLWKCLVVGLGCCLWNGQVGSGFVWVPVFTEENPTNAKMEGLYREQNFKIQINISGEEYTNTYYTQTFAIPNNFNITNISGDIGDGHIGEGGGGHGGNRWIQSGSWGLLYQTYEEPNTTYIKGGIFNNQTDMEYGFNEFITKKYQSMKSPNYAFDMMYQTMMVVWGDLNDMYIYGQIYAEPINFNVSLQINELIIIGNITEHGICAYPSVSASNGRFLVVFGCTQDGHNHEVIGQYVNASNGNLIGENLLMGQFSYDGLIRPVVSRLRNGRSYSFVVVTNGVYENKSSIFFIICDSNTVSSPTPISEIDMSIYDPFVLGVRGGGFVVSYTFGSAIRVQKYYVNGTSTSILFHDNASNARLFALLRPGFDGYVITFNSLFIVENANHIKAMMRIVESKSISVDDEFVGDPVTLSECQYCYAGTVSALTGVDNYQKFVASYYQLRTIVVELFMLNVTGSLVTTGGSTTTEEPAPTTTEEPGTTTGEPGPTTTEEPEPTTTESTTTELTTTELTTTESTTTEESESTTTEESESTSTEEPEFTTTEEPEFTTTEESEPSTTEESEPSTTEEPEPSTSIITTDPTTTEVIETTSTNIIVPISTPASTWERQGSIHIVLTINCHSNSNCIKDTLEIAKNATREFLKRQNPNLADSKNVRFLINEDPPEIIIEVRNNSIGYAINSTCSTEAYYAQIRDSTNGEAAVSTIYYDEAHQKAASRALSNGAIIGIIAAAIFSFLLLLGGLIYYLWYIRPKRALAEIQRIDMKELTVQVVRPSSKLKQVSTATTTTTTTTTTTNDEGTKEYTTI